jgi:hypothetical protein
MNRAQMMERVQGYQAHFNRIDSEVAHECGCEACGSKHVHYNGFKQGASYLAFIECEDCGICAEF